MKAVVSRLARSFLRDKRLHFCLIVYPALFLIAAYFKTTGLYAFLLKHSMECFFALFLIFILSALGLILDAFQLLTLKAQGGKLKIKEQEGKRSGEYTEKRQ